MNNPKKIYMILTNGFDPDVRVYKEAKYLYSVGFDIEIICWDRKGDYLDKKEEVLEGIKIKRFCISAKPGTGMKQLFPYFKFIKCVKNYLKDKDYSYLHCHDFDGIIVGMSTKKKKLKKIIFDMHEIYNNYSYAKNFLFKKIYTKILKISSNIIYVNEKQIRDMPPEIKEKTIYLPNYPELDIYMPIEKKESKKLRVNYVGSLRDYDSLKALAKFGEDNENFEVGLYGTGICFEELKKEYENSKIKIHGKYNGILESGEIYRNTDILYCSYNPEVENWKTSYPVKLFEAIITLTPIIVTKNTVAGDFVLQNSTGECIEYNNIASINEAVKKIEQNYNQYVQKLKAISDNYKWERIVLNLNNIYNLANNYKQDGFEEI